MKQSNLIDEEEQDVCPCKAELIDEMNTLDRVRTYILPRMTLYNEEEMTYFLKMIVMFPSFATVSEIVEDIVAYKEEADNDR